MIAKNPTIAETINAKIADIDNPLSRLNSPNPAAPQLAGTLIKKLNRKASFFSNPLKIKIETVVADRLIPGRIANPCPIPDKIASFVFIVFALRMPKLRRKRFVCIIPVNNINKPIMSIAMELIDSEISLRINITAETTIMLVKVDVIKNAVRGEGCRGSMINSLKSEVNSLLK